MILKSSSCIFFNFVELIGFSFVFTSLEAISQSGFVGRGPNLEPVYQRCFSLSVHKVAGQVLGFGQPMVQAVSC